MDVWKGKLIAPAEEELELYAKPRFL